MKLSIITVCLNAERTIERTIRSVLEQDYRNIEYIVIDGGSNDKTHNIISKYVANISQYIAEPDLGIYDAMNKGIKASSGDILYFLNADDALYNNTTISNIISLMQKKTCDLMYGNVIVTDTNSGSEFIKTHSNINKSYFFENTICHQSIFARKELFERYGVFDAVYKIAGDFEWLMRVLWKYRVTCIHADVVVAVYSATGMSSGSSWAHTLDKERAKVIEQHFHKLEIAIYHKQLLNKLSRIPLLQSTLSRLLQWNLS